MPSTAPKGTGRWWDQLLFAMFLGLFGAVWIKTVWSVPALEKAGWLEGALLFLATVSVVNSIAKTLPFQNVLWGGIIIGGIGGVAHAIGTLSSIPFGPYVYTNAAGPRVFRILPWTVPLTWILFIYTSRGLARLTLRPWRKLRVYGFWLMGLTAVFSLILDLGMDPFASRLKHYWIWEPTKFPYDWQGTPFINFAGWLITAVFVMVFVTPMLINKKPGHSPAEYRSSIIWLLLNLLFITAALVHGFWVVALVVFLLVIITAIFAVRGARW